MKDKAYWKEYNQKRKGYLVLKQKEQRLKKKSIQPKYNPTLSSSEIIMEKVKELLLVYQRDKEKDKVAKAQRYHVDLLNYLIWTNKKTMNKKIYDQNNKEDIEKWITFLIIKVEEENISKEVILDNLKRLKKFFFEKK